MSHSSAHTPPRGVRRRRFCPPVGARAVPLLVLALALPACSGSESSPLEPAKVAPPPPTPRRVALGPVAGRWAGPVVELRTPNRYKATIVLVDSAGVGEQAGTVEYDSAGFVTPFHFKCGGELTFATIEAETYAFGERITQGGPCTTGGTVRLTRNQDGTLAANFFGPQGNLGAQATLTRLP